MPGLRRIIAPNPSPMTHWGTNTFILGKRNVAIVDPGPHVASHLDAILAATQGEEITDILVTHAHRDHSDLAHPLAERTGARISAMLPDAPELDLPDLGGGEGVDTSFAPQTLLSDGDTVEGGAWHVRVVHTPGHFSGHLAFDTGTALLTGDHVFDWASTFISPPHGSVKAFMETSERLIDLADRLFLPAHGAAITAPANRLNWLMDHRRSREREILAATSRSPASLTEITARVYRDIPPPMLAAASRNVLAHLIDLLERNEVEATPALSPDALFHRR